MMYIDAKRQQRSKLDKGFMLCYAFMEDKAVPVIVEKIWTKLYVGSIKSQTKVKTLPLFDRMSNMAPFLSRKFLGSVTRESWIQQPSSGAPFPCYRAQTHLLLAPPFLVFSPFTSQCFLPEVSEYRLGLSDTTPAGNFRVGRLSSEDLIPEGTRPFADISNILEITTIEKILLLVL
ncbi:uncharacterized protein LOC129364001 isoform X2 [Poeciliopsis prolifica]|uniref:uncharacterized protein LOC129364001 isoform X2 n=1 Tax=Poeciliopsis prolifica TaxID=188132 RepID=UPI002412F5F4|nr:uncharacterized protein LOC129364001 isoform X2 [Poeciliopsis prolifica]